MEMAGSAEPIPPLYVLDTRAAFVTLRRSGTLAAKLCSRVIHWIEALSIG